MIQANIPAVARSLEDVQTIFLAPCPNVWFRHLSQADVYQLFTVLQEEKITSNGGMSYYMVQYKNGSGIQSYPQSAYLRGLQ